MYLYYFEFIIVYFHVIHFQNFNQKEAKLQKEQRGGLDWSGSN